jgi:heme/copper-type cytochrome/quinol oxidase subunit 2
MKTLWFTLVLTIFGVVVAMLIVDRVKVRAHNRGDYVTESTCDRVLIWLMAVVIGLAGTLLITSQ